MDVTQLSSAATSGQQSPDPVFNVDIFDFEDVATQNALQFEFLLDTTPDPDPLEVKLEDNVGLDLPVDDSSMTGSAHSDSDSSLDDSHDLHPLDLPWLQDCSEMELLTACTDHVDPASRALYKMEQMI